MCLTGALLRSVLVVLVLAETWGKHTCNYQQILDFYRGVILVELHNLNLTSSYNTSNARDPCPSSKAHRILSSIYNTTQQMRCHKSRKQPSDLEKPLESMEQLIRDNCSTYNLGEKHSCPANKKIRGKKRKRNKFIQVIKALIVCWQKLHSAYTPK